MKKLVKFGSLALCLTLCTVMLAACGGETTKIKLNKVDLYYFAGASASTEVASTAATEKDGVITVEVSADTYCVEVDLKPFLDANTKVLGKDFSFTRSDMTGKGYAYQLVGEGTTPATDNTWKKYGADATVAANVIKESEIVGPKLFIMENEDRVSVYLFQDQTKQTPADVFTAEKTYTFKFTGDNDKKYQLKIKVVLETPETPEA